jgi:hypothetical protein
MPSTGATVILAVAAAALGIAGDRWIKSGEDAELHFSFPDLNPSFVRAISPNESFGCKAVASVAVYENKIADEQHSGVAIAETEKARWRERYDNEPAFRERLLETTRRWRRRVEAKKRAVARKKV